MLSHLWRIELFGGLQARQDTRILARFRTQKVGALLAYLALNRAQAPLREQIAGILWPESDSEAGRASLRTALASLRQQLEPPGTPANCILLADRVRIGLNAEATATDVSDFEAAIRRSLQAASPEAALQTDLLAVEQYRGELLSGWYEEWIYPERRRLGLLYEEALQRIVSVCEHANDLERAIAYAQRWVAMDRTNEEAHLRLMRLFAAHGRADAAVRQFRDLEGSLQAETGATPSAGIRAWVRRLQTDSVANENGGSGGFSPSSTSVKDPCPQSAPANLATTLSPLSSLPLPLTRFFGREAEIGHLLQMLTPCRHALSPDSASHPHTGERFVTLTGPGGSGKTRLAIEAAGRLRAAYDGAVTFVPLAELTTAERIPGTIAEALRLPLVAHHDPLQPIILALSGGSHLLVLDNFEQLLNCSPAETQTEGSDSALLVRALLTRLPHLSILVTSRQRLDVDGEREYYVPPLPTPDTPCAAPEQLLEFAGVQLFVDRAQGVRADFQLKPQNGEAVSALCTKLEGIPLALELAAAWSHLLSPTQMLARMEHRFDLLVSKRKGIASRHQTLRAAIDWSYRLLSPSLQRFFARLSVFAGSWTLEAAEAVCGEAEVLEQLNQLAERSFLISEEVSAEGCTQMRYRLLESLREFAAEQISEEERSGMRRRHLDWYAQWAGVIHRHSMDTEQVAWLQRAEWEQENFRAALQWSLTQEDACLPGLELFGNLTQFWCLRGNYAEVHALADRFLAHPCAQVPTRPRAMCLALAGTIAQFQKDWRAAEHYHTECLEVGRQSDNQGIMATSLMSLGGIAAEQGETALARCYFRQSGVHYEALGNPVGVAAAQGAFGQVEMDLHHYESALPYVLRAVELQRQESNLSGVTHHLNLLAVLYGRLGRVEPMRLCLLESMEGYRLLKDTRGLADLFSNLVEMLPASESAVRVMGAAQTSHTGIAAAPLSLEDAIARGRSALGDATFERAWKQGCAFTFDQAIEEARLLLAMTTTLEPPS